MRTIGNRPRVYVSRCGMNREQVASGLSDATVEALRQIASAALTMQRNDI
jgi:hypothetical protein